MCLCRLSRHDGKVEKMEAAKALIENCWIDKKTDKELYMKVRRELPKCQKFFREQLGWTVINNEQILKMDEKVYTVLSREVIRQLLLLRMLMEKYCL